MRRFSLRSSRSAYVFVTLNLVLLLIFLVVGSSNLRSVQSTLATYDELLHDWYAFRIALDEALTDEARPDAPPRVQALPEYQRLAQLMVATESSAAIRAAAQLSEELSESVRKVTDLWEALETDNWYQTMATESQQEQAATTLNRSRLDELQSSLLVSHAAVRTFVGTQERALSVLLFCLSATIVLVILVFVAVEIENERGRREALRTQLLAQNALEAQEAERTRIAHSLHDTLAQELSLAALESDLLRQSVDSSKRETATVAGRLNERLRAAIDWVRNLAYELEPAEIEKVGLAAALGAYCSEVQSKTTADLSWRVSDELQKLPLQRAMNLYRIAQEAVTNAIRHSGATTISLELHSAGQQVEMIVRDNGIGMNVALRGVDGGSHGLGMEGMKQRARMLGSELEVESRAGAGTTVRVSISMAQAPEGR